MTQISINHYGNMHEIKIKGHAGYGACGADIVCAGISTLTFTLINRLENLKENELVEEFEYIQGDGEMCITFMGDSIEAKASIETIEIGFLMLSENFSKNIFISGEK